jgi:3-oxoadipate enol-lactonase
VTVALAHSLIGDRDKPMLVMSSSLGTTRDMWESQHVLQSHHSLLLYDHRGHGESPAPAGPYSIDDLGGDVIALLDTLGVRVVSFCGLSLGGMVGLWLAARHPDRIDRLIAISSLARLEPVSRYTERAAAARSRGMPAIAADVVSRWFTPGFGEQHRAIVDAFIATLAAMSAEGYASSCEALAGADLRRNISRIDAPTLLIAGAEDPIVPPAAAVMFGSSFREATVAVVPDAAHLSNVQQPEMVNRLVLEHLADGTGGHT